jgi:tRNA U34 5-carboxymethylaminomethyl modifying enzyme MnmG/GidA
VWALRAQTDKLEYSTVMRRVLEGTPNLFMREGMAVDLDIGPNDEVKHSERAHGSLVCRQQALNVHLSLDVRPVACAEGTSWGPAIFHSPEQ